MTFQEAALSGFAFRTEGTGDGKSFNWVKFNQVGQLVIFNENNPDKESDAVFVIDALLHDNFYLHPTIKSHKKVWNLLFNKKIEQLVNKED